MASRRFLFTYYYIGVLFCLLFADLATHYQVGNGSGNEHRGEGTANDTQNHSE